MVSGPRSAALATRVVGMAAVLALFGHDVGCGQETTQGLTVMPVRIEMLAGQMTTVLTLENHTLAEVVFQVRPFAWAEQAGEDHLTPTDGLLVSPPLGKMAVGAGQVVRLVLRRPTAERESTYRILVDQVPPPPQQGTVNFALRLSIPVFAEPATRTSPHVRWRLEPDGGAFYLVAFNDGSRHETYRNMRLATADGRVLALDTSVSPYVLAGGTRRWRIMTPSFAPSREALRLTAHADTSVIDQAVSATSAGP
jgi:fimbrial chaperone protein